MMGTLAMPANDGSGARQAVEPSGAQDSTAGLSLEWRDLTALSATQLYELLQFRQAVFVVEQASPYPDLDGRDIDARHLALRRSGMLIGYLRLILPDDTADQ